MKTEIDTAISTLLKMIKDNTTPDAVLKCTQAALNLAHTKATLEGINR